MRLFARSRVRDWRGYNPQPSRESWNQTVFALNDGVDRFVPTTAKTGVSNVLGNFIDVTSAINSSLQWRWKEALSSTGRVIVNTKLRLAGIFDVAMTLGVGR